MEPIDAISVFTNLEVKTAIAAVAPGEDAERISTEIYSISKARRNQYGWTEYALTLLAMSSPQTLKKVQTLVGGTDDEWKRRFRSIQEFIAAGHVSENMGIEDFVQK